MVNHTEIKTEPESHHQNVWRVPQWRRAQNIYFSGNATAFYMRPLSCYKTPFRSDHSTYHLFAVGIPFAQLPLHIVVCIVVESVIL